VSRDLNLLVGAVGLSALGDRLAPDAVLRGRRPMLAGLVAIAVARRRLAAVAVSEAAA
jgi:hypothetical protein